MFLNSSKIFSVSLFHFYHHPLHELGPDRTVSATYNKSLQRSSKSSSSIRSTIQHSFAILLLFIPVTCRSQLDLYLLGLSSTSSTLKLSRNFFILFVVKKFVPDCSENFHLDLRQSFLYPFPPPP